MSNLGIPGAKVWTGDIPCWSCRLSCPAGCDCACHDNDSDRPRDLQVDDQAAGQAVNAEALYDALMSAAEAVLAGEVGETAKQEAALMEASVAAVGAFPAGTPESDALGLILAAAGRVTEDAL